MFGFIPAPILYGLRLARAGQARDPRGADRPRHPAATCSSSSTGRRATTTARPRRRSRARASRCRALETYAWRAVGLLGAQPRSRPLHRPHRSRGRSRTRWSSSPAARRASARRRRSSSPSAGAQGDPRRARRGEARRDASRRSRRRAASAGSTRRDIADLRVVRRARRARAEGARRAATSSSTTPAARSAAASINSFDRFHDFERTMQLNYFGALRLIMGFLPTMIAQKQRPHHQHLARSACCRTRRASRPTSRRRRRSTRSRACAASRVPRQGHPLHDDQHAAGAHADDRADQDLRERADAVAGGGRRPRRRGDRPPAGAHRDAPRHLRRGLPRDRAASSRRCCSTRRSTCSRTRAAAQGKKGGEPQPLTRRADGVRAAHAGDSLVATRARGLAPRLRRRRAIRSDERRGVGRAARCGRCRRARCSRRRRAATIVCGATIESCHDHSDTIARAASDDVGAVERGEPRVAGPQLRERRAGHQPRVDAAVVRRAERRSRAAPSPRRTGAGTRARRGRPCCAPTIDDLRARRCAARIASIFARDLVGERARSTRAAGRTTACRPARCRACAR